MITHHCGYCGARAHFLPFGPTHRVSEAQKEGSIALLQSAFTCSACQLLSLGSRELVDNMPEWDVSLVEGQEADYWASIGVADWQPTSAAAPLPELPALLNDAWLEAISCLESGKYLATITVVRAAIITTANTVNTANTANTEANAADLSNGSAAAAVTALYESAHVSEGTFQLVNQLESLATNGLISQPTAKDEVAACVEVLGQIFDAMFELPS